VKESIAELRHLSEGLGWGHWRLPKKEPSSAALLESAGTKISQLVASMGALEESLKALDAPSRKLLGPKLRKLAETLAGLAGTEE